MEGLGYEIYMTSMEDLADYYPSIAAMVNADVQVYCDILYGFSDLCDQDKTIDTITQDDITNSATLSTYPIVWDLLKVSLESIDWWGCTDMFTDATDIANCQAYYEDGTIPADPSVFPLTQCYSTCDIQNY